MKTVGIEQTTLDTCVAAAQRERVLLTRNGQPVALVVGLEGLDEEQVELGSSSAFWELIAQRRKEKTLSREALEQALRSHAPESEGATDAPS
jgi:antitoxin (DNA-binding transcriptional repressor) of toxin-antitoxin stability system